MNAQHDYVIRMTKAELPPAIAFWSLTLYDAKNGFFIPNKQKKYSVGENTGMKLNTEGGIEIHVASLLGAASVHVVDFHSNSQIVGRASPRLLDLIVALAAGTAGAFATSRDDVGDSLPGVAISIALVPPLCVVGISLAAGQWEDAWGALLLFLTNFLSILLAGGALFALLGLGRAATANMSDVNRRKAYGIIALGVLLVAIPLSINTSKVYRDSTAQAKITNITNEWAGQYPTDSVIRSVLVSGDKVKILITGSERPSTIDDLTTQVRSEVAQVANIDLRFVPSKDYRYP